MKIAIMQPYFFPYIGYFQLMNLVDEFVVYDNIKYTKKGWINRNRILVRGNYSYISLPLKRESDFLEIRDRSLSKNWISERRKMLNRLTEPYKKAPEFTTCYSIIEKCILFEEVNLFKFLLNSLLEIEKYLDITTPLRVSSTINIDSKLKAEKKVIKICELLKADVYINPIRAVKLGLYDKTDFQKQNIKLQFLKSNDFHYKQYDNQFIPWLSIIDVMMFNSKEQIKLILNEYEIID